MFLAIALSVVTVSSQSLGQEIELTTLDGKKSVGKLTNWTVDKLVVQVGEESLDIPSADLLALRPITATAGKKPFAPHVEFLDGTRIPCTDFTVTNRQATIVTPLAAEPLKISTEQIRFVQFLPMEANDASWQKSDLTGDVLVVSKKDSEQTETLEGVIGEVSAEQVEFSWEGDTIPVKRAKIAALAFYHANVPESATPVCVLQLSSGAQISVSGIKLSDNGLQVVTPDKLVLTFPFADLVSADYSIGKLTFLSDIQPLRSEWTPLVALPAAAESIKNFGEPRSNSSFTGSPLALSWPADENQTNARLETYDKGLAIRSRTELEYRLPKSLRRFTAIAGIDPETLAQGSVQLTIELDGQVALTQTIDGQHGPVKIDLDVAGKQRLKLLVDYGENLDLGDRLHMVEARFVK